MRSALTSVSKWGNFNHAGGSYNLHHNLLQTERDPIKPKSFITLSPVRKKASKEALLILFLLNQQSTADKQDRFAENQIHFI